MPGERTLIQPGDLIPVSEIQDEIEQEIHYRAVRCGLCSKAWMIPDPITRRWKGGDVRQVAVVHCTCGEEIRKQPAVS